MSNEQSSNQTPKKSGLAKAGLVLGIIAASLAVIGFFPCLGIIAVWLAIIIAFVGGACAFFAPKGSSKKPGLILCGVGIVIALGAWCYQGALVEEIEKEMKKVEQEIEKADQDFKREMRKLDRDFNREMKKLDREMEREFNNF